MEHFARELLHGFEVSRKRARIHLWNREQGKFYINNVCFRLVKLETNARGYLIRREEKKLGVYLPDVICELPAREYEAACNRLDQLFDDRNFFYIKTSRALGSCHNVVTRARGYTKYFQYFLDVVLLDKWGCVETFDTLEKLKAKECRPMELKHGK